MMMLLKNYKYHIFVVFFWLLLYVPNITNQYFGGDSAEFSSVLTSWGIAHPSGYPLYTLIGNIFSSFFSQKQYGLSLLGALINLTTLLILFSTFQRYTKIKIFALLPTIFFGVNYLFWFYGLVPEVFALALLLLAIQYCSLLALSGEDNMTQNKRNFYMYAFVTSFGFSVAHHHIFIFYLPGYIYLFWKSSKIKHLFFEYKWKNMLLLIFTSFIFYLYIPATSYINDIYGMTNTKTIQGLYEMITRAPYGSFRAYAGASADFFNMFLNISSVLLYILMDYRILGCIFVVLGVVYLYQKKPILFGFFGINTLSLLFFYFYSNFNLHSNFNISTLERFLVFIYFNVLFYFSFGLTYSNSLLTSLFQNYSKHKKWSQFFIFFVGLLFSSLIINNFQRNNPTISSLKKTNDFHLFAQDIIDSIDKKSIYIPIHDNSTFLTSALLNNTKYRDDIILFDPSSLQKGFGLARLKDQIFIPNNPKDSKAFEIFLKGNFDRKINIISENPFSTGYWFPIGLMWKYYPSKDSLLADENVNIKKNEEFWRRAHIPSIDSNRDIPFLLDIFSYYAKSMWVYIGTLNFSNRNELALRYADQYIDKFYREYYFRIMYIDLKTTLKSCDKKLDAIFAKMLGDSETSLREFKDYQVFSNYYNVCKNDKINADKFKKGYQLLRDVDRIPLQNL